MAEGKSTHVQTEYVTTGKRPVIVVTGKGGRKGTYPTDRHTTATHEAAVIKWAAKNAGKGATVTKIEDGQMGDRYLVTATPAPDTETAPVATTS